MTINTLDPDGLGPREYAFSTSEFQFGENNSESLTGDASSELLSGGGGNDTLIGEAGEDLLEGGAGTDTIIGGAGSDRLAGGAGNDHLTGGPDKDVFVAMPDGSFDVVADFEPGVDLIDLRSFSSQVAIDAIQNARQGSVILDFPDGTTLHIEGANFATFGLDDVILSNASPDGQPAIEGEAVQGEVLVADVSGMSDADDIDASSLVFQWLRDGTPIAGASGDSYTLTQADVGAEISVEVSYTDGGGTLESVTSDQTLHVETNVANATIVELNLSFDMGSTDVWSGYAETYSGASSETQVVVNGANSKSAIYRGDFVPDPTYGDMSGQVNSYEEYLDGELLYKITGLDFGIWFWPGMNFGLQPQFDQLLSGDDKILGSEFYDTIVGFDGDDSLDGGGGNDRLLGSAGRDTLAGGLGDDRVSGGSDDDLIVYDGGLDTIFGEGGKDTIDFSNFSAAVFVQLSHSADTVRTTNTASATSGSLETIAITPSLDVEGISGTSFDDFLRGSNSNDILSGGAGNDTVFSLEGDDRFEFLDGQDEWDGGTGADTASFANYEADVFISLDEERVTQLNNQAVALVSMSNVENAVGGQGNDVIEGDAIANVLEGSSGNDTLDGGAGRDTANYSGNQASYTLTLSPSATTITDRREDGNGTDDLIDMELLDFDTEIPALGGNPLNLEMFGGPTELGADAFSDLIELYIAYFNRAPDALGLNFWATAYSNGQPLEEIATLFLDQVETRALYPDGTSNSVFLENVYENVLGRLPDQGGFDFWEGHLDSGALGRDEFIFNFLGGAQGSDVGFLENKVKIGTYFAVTKGMSDGANGAAAMDMFDGTDASMDAAVAAIDAFHADALDPDTGAFLMPLIGVLDDPFGGG